MELQDRSFERIQLKSWDDKEGRKGKEAVEKKYKMLCLERLLKKTKISLETWSHLPQVHYSKITKRKTKTGLAYLI